MLSCFFTPNLASSCQAYTGSVCSAVVNYTFSTPSAPWQVVETNLTDLGMNILKSFEASNPACIQELIALSCLQSFPQCSGQGKILHGVNRCCRLTHLQHLSSKTPALYYSFTRARACVGEFKPIVMTCFSK